MWSQNGPIYYSSAEKTCKGSFLDFFGMGLDCSTDNKIFGEHALGSKTEKWRMAALDVEQLCET